MITKYSEILKLLDEVEVKNYQRTRNFLDGEVTHLSPYLTHGVLNTYQVAQYLVSKYGLRESEHFIFQLCWREYFHKVWQIEQDKIFTGVRSEQEPVFSELIPKSVNNASTGIVVIDKAIQDLYKTGYMHNHARMWLASIVCNIAKTNFRKPADWLFYHLLDGDFASNYLSWQWVCGTFSSKKYLCNQDNLNKYSKTVQRNTVIDKSYEELNELALNKEYVGEDFIDREELDLKPCIPVFGEAEYKFKFKNLRLFSIWTLNPKVSDNTETEKVLLIEPSQLNKFPMSKKRIDFILALAENIEGLKILVIDFTDFMQMYASNFEKIESEFHNALSQWHGVEWINPRLISDGIEPPFRSYFDFWNKVKRNLRNEFKK